jgi:hypothetical protein
MQPMPRDPAAPIQPDPTAPMRLAHAAAMFGLTVSALRTEAKHGRLVISRVAGKDFVRNREEGCGKCKEPGESHWRSRSGAVHAAVTLREFALSYKSRKPA